MSGPDENAVRAEDKADDVGANPRESGHSTADMQAERNAEDESPS
jgi:hypothetical protein